MCACAIARLSPVREEVLTLRQVAASCARSTQSSSQCCAPYHREEALRQVATSCARSSHTIIQGLCARSLDCCASLVCAVHVTILGLLARPSDFYAERGSEVRALKSADGPNPNFAPNIYTHTTLCSQYQFDPYACSKYQLLHKGVS